MKIEKKTIRKTRITCLLEQCYSFFFQFHPLIFVSMRIKLHYLFQFSFKEVILVS